MTASTDDKNQDISASGQDSEAGGVPPVAALDVPQAVAVEGAILVPAGGAQSRGKAGAGEMDSSLGIRIEDPGAMERDAEIAQRDDRRATGYGYDSPRTLIDSWEASAAQKEAAGQRPVLAPFGKLAVSYHPHDPDGELMENVAYGAEVYDPAPAGALRLDPRMVLASLFNGNVNPLVWVYQNAAMGVSGGRMDQAQPVEAALEVSPLNMFALNAADIVTAARSTPAVSTSGPRVHAPVHDPFRNGPSFS